MWNLTYDIQNSWRYIYFVCYIHVHVILGIPVCTPCCVSLFQLVSVGDVVRGHVIDKSPRELSIQVTSFVGSHKQRELSDIGVKVSTVSIQLLANMVARQGGRVSCMSTSNLAFFPSKRERERQHGV